MGQQGFGGQFHKDFDAATRPNSAISGTQGAGVNRSASSASTAVAHGQTNSQGIPSRNNTLKKKASMRRTTGATGSLKRSGSRKSLAAGSIKSVQSPGEVFVRTDLLFRQSRMKKIKHARQISISVDAHHRDYTEKYLQQ